MKLKYIIYYVDYIIYINIFCLIEYGDSELKF